MEVENKQSGTENNTQVVDGQPKEKVEESKKTDSDNGHGEWFNSLPKEAQEEIVKLRNESAKFRTRSNENTEKLQKLEEMEKNFKEEKEKKMQEEGKLKELLGEKNKEIETLKPEAEKSKGYAEFFTEMLDNELKGLDEKYIKLIQSANVDIKEKYEMAKQFRIDINKRGESPASNPPGGEFTMNESLVDQYKKEKDINKKMDMLTEAEKRDPALYQKMLKT